jgi:hypothetical protein
MTFPPGLYFTGDTDLYLQLSLKNLLGTVEMIKPSPVYARFTISRHQSSTRISRFMYFVQGYQ